MSSTRLHRRNVLNIVLYFVIVKKVADKLGHQVNSDSYAHISSIASCTQFFLFCIKKVVYYWEDSDLAKKPGCRY